MKKIISFLATAFLIITIVTSCGPRSGISNDNEQIENVARTDNQQTSKKAIDVWYDEADGKLFKRNCAVCHFLTDQVLIGPGLAGVKDRLPKPAEDWFVKYTLNSEKVFESGDPYAAKLKDTYKVMPMPAFEDALTEQEIKRIYKVVTFSSSQALP